MGQLNGVFPAVVIDNVDPENLGRVQVQLPQMDESGQRGSKVWARMATLMAGKNRARAVLERDILATRRLDNEALLAALIV